MTPIKELYNFHKCKIRTHASQCPCNRQGGTFKFKQYVRHIGPDGKEMLATEIERWFKQNE